MSDAVGTKRIHEYLAQVTWEGNLGQGTSNYTSYSRSYRVHIAGKPDLAGTADPMFRGEPDKHNPEDLFLTALATCHMLSYLALCARKGIQVIGYEDEARGVLALEPRGGGRFEEVTLRPVVTIADAEHVALAEQLHDTAHDLCFIANSCSAPVHHEATVQVH
ncbi:MAG TPA: OsmC family protein [Rhodothermales bacterium]|nr:OsmC family protein [Rhodothermales bacterium]